jgi:hypothetical protein
MNCLQVWLVLVMIFSGWPIVTPTQAEAHAAGGAFAPHHPSSEPPECATKLVFRPREPIWIFVLNFEKLDAKGAPIGCLKLYRTVMPPVLSVGEGDYKLVPCKVVGNSGSFSVVAGQGHFNGGYVFCELNVRQTLATLNPSVEIAPEVHYGYFTIVASGSISDTNEFDTYSNPVAYYRPSNAAFPDMGLFVPWSFNGLQIVSRFNDVENMSKQTPITLGALYTFTVEHDDDDGTAGATVTATHYLDEHASGTTITETFAPRNPVKMWTDGGAFVIGASFITGSTDRRLSGVLEEIFFDPTDATRPPSGAQYRYVFMPLVLR